MQQIRVFQQRIKPIQQGHSWIFSGAIKENSAPQSVGIAEVLDEEGQVLGYGFSDTESQISCRMFHLGPKPADGFKPAYWKHKFEVALSLRTEQLAGTNTTCFRLVHAEGDGLPGLIVDVYGQVAYLHTVVQATGQWFDTWATILRGMGFLFIYHRHGIEKQGKWLGEKPSGPLVIYENQLKFEVDVETGQKTGFFIDQRDNRQIIRSLANGKKVLNAFGYTGGFSVYALAGGAKEVVTVDISKEACQMADENAELNGFTSGRHSSVAADCFDYLRTMEKDFDLIVLDPPAFAKNSKSVDKATSGYKEINLQAFRNIKSGGLVASFSCSQHIDRELFWKIVAGAARDSGRFVQVIHSFHQGPDHPIAIGHPEGEYLKGFLLRVI